MALKSLLLFLIFLIIEKTCSWKYRGESDFKLSLNSSRPILICTWHGGFIFPMIFLKKTRPDAFVISSTHKDSLVLGKVLQHYGFHLIKGSSSRGSRNVLKQMIALFKKSHSLIAITNDGPKGPPRVAKKGALNLAHKMGAELLFISGKSSNFWSLKTWDRFTLPKPFAKNLICIKKINIPLNVGNQSVASYVSNKMNEIQNEIDNTNL